MLLYLIRHGDPDYSTDTLTLRGMFQAEAVGKRMFDAGIDRIFTSPMGRARLTASPAARMLGLTPQIEEWAHEVGPEIKTTFPDGSFRSVSQLPGYHLRANGGQDVSCADALTHAPYFSGTRMGLTMAYIHKSGRDFLERLGYREKGEIYRILRPNEERVALFCHAGLMRAWVSILLHIPVHLVWADFGVTHTGVTVLEFKNLPEGITAPKCRCFSDISHLYAAGLDLRYNNGVRI